MIHNLDYRLHRDPSQLEGTQYFEIAPGPYQNEHWQPSSTFIHSDTFILFEYIFEKRCPRYDRCGYCELNSTTWNQVLDDMSELRAALSASGDLATARASPEHTPTDWRHPQGLPITDPPALALLLLEFETWGRNVAAAHSTVTIQGL